MSRRPLFRVGVLVGDDHSCPGDNGFGRVGDSSGEGRGTDLTERGGRTGKRQQEDE